MTNAPDLSGPRPPESLIERALSAAGDAADGREAHAEVLDAAYELFCRQGVQRTTMDDVARRAGLSRITVYRRVTSKEALVEQVVLREFRRYFDRFLLDIARAETLADRVAVGFVSAMRAIRTHPLIGAHLLADPQLLVPSILGEGGRTMAAVSRFVAGQLRREQAAGNVADAVDVDLVAELMVRLSGSLLLSSSELVDVDDDARLDEIARNYLVPMLTER